MQYTLSNPVKTHGVGLHSGQAVSLEMRPAPVNAGIRFIRTDIASSQNREIKASFENVVDTRLCTVIGNPAGVTVATIEHVMAAIHAAGITNAEILVDGPEMPIMDGSSKAFTDMIDTAGIKAQKAPRKAFKILEPVSYFEDGKSVTLSPCNEMRFVSEIDFDDGIIGRQRYAFDLSYDDFKDCLSEARTFGYIDELSYLRRNGKAQGASLDNAIALDRESKTVLNPEGLRYPGREEFVRHKTLDAVGDIALLGGQIYGLYHGIKAGHAMNNEILHVLASRPDAYIEIAIDDSKAGRFAEKHLTAMAHEEVCA